METLVCPSCSAVLNHGSESFPDTKMAVCPSCKVRSPLGSWRGCSLQGKDPNETGVGPMTLFAVVGLTAMCALVIGGVFVYAIFGSRTSSESTSVKTEEPEVIDYGPDVYRRKLLFKNVREGLPDREKEEHIRSRARSAPKDIAFLVGVMGPDPAAWGTAIRYYGNGAYESITFADGLCVGWSRYQKTDSLRDAMDLVHNESSEKAKEFGPREIKGSGDSYWIFKEGGYSIRLESVYGMWFKHTCFNSVELIDGKYNRNGKSPLEVEYFYKDVPEQGIAPVVADRPESAPPEGERPRRVIENRGQQ